MCMPLLGLEVIGHEILSLFAFILAASLAGCASSNPTPSRALESGNNNSAAHSGDILPDLHPAADPAAVSSAARALMEADETFPGNGRLPKAALDSGLCAQC